MPRLVRSLLIDRPLFSDCFYSSNCSGIWFSASRNCVFLRAANGSSQSRSIHLRRRRRQTPAVCREVIWSNISGAGGRVKSSRSALGRDNHTKRLIPQNSAASTLALLTLTRRTSKCHLTVSRSQSHDKTGQITPSITRVTAAAQDRLRCVSIDHIITLHAGAGRG